MPLDARAEGVVLLGEGSVELLLSGAGFRSAGEYRTLERPGPTEPWDDVIGLRVLPPDRRLVLGRLAALVWSLVLGDAWTTGSPTLGCRLEVQQEGRRTVHEVHLGCRDRRELKVLIAWINRRLAGGQDLAQLDSGQPFWRELSRRSA